MTQPEIGQLPIGTLIDGRYRLTRKLGCGAFGAVYMADQMAYGTAFRSVALKLFMKSVYDVFQAREMLNDALVLTKLVQNCPDAETAALFLQVYDVGSYETDPGNDNSETRGYMAMELMANDLRNVVGKTGHKTFRVCTVKGAFTYMIPVVRALAYMHSQNPPLLHRDLKPDNVLLKPGDSLIIKVGDFGLAVPIPKLMGQPHAKGMLRYLDIESLTLHTAAPQSDVFALGMMFYELLTGQYPFKGDYLQHTPESRISRKIMEDLARSELSKKITSPSRFNAELKKEAWLERIILECLTPYRQERIKDAQVLLNRLERPEVSTPATTLEERYKGLLELGDRFRAMGRPYFEEAEIHYQKALKLAPLYCDAVIKISDLLCDQKQCKAALDMLLERNEVYACACVRQQIGKVYRRIGNNQLAEYYGAQAASRTACPHRMIR